MPQTVSDIEGMPTLRLEFFKDLCKHQAAQISDLSAQVTTQQQHIVRLEEYISKLEANLKAISMPSCGPADPLVNPLVNGEGSAPGDGGVPYHNPSRRAGEKGKEKEVKLEVEDVLRPPQGLPQEHPPTGISRGVVGHATTRVGFTVLGAAAGARNSVVAVSTRLGPCDEAASETDQNARVQQQARNARSIGRSVEVRIPPKTARGSDWEDKKDQTVAVRKRKAEEDLSSLPPMRPQQSKKVRFTLTTYDTSNPAPSVIQPTKIRPAANKPSSLAYLNPFDTTRMRDALHFHAKGYVRDGQMAGARSDRPPDAASSTSPSQVLRRLADIRRTAWHNLSLAGDPEKGLQSARPLGLRNKPS